MAAEAKLSHTAAMILQAIHIGYLYGFSVMEQTGLPSGTVYPALRRLERDGLIRSEWEKQGIDTLLIDVKNSHSREWLPRLQPLISRRAAHLNWTDRRNWDPASLPAKLFREFGPRGKTESLTGNYLPAVIVFHQLHRPKLFTFGARSKDLEEKLERLRAELSN